MSISIAIFTLHTSLHTRMLCEHPPVRSVQADTCSTKQRTRSTLRLVLLETTGRAALEIDEERVPDSLQQRALCLGVLDLVALPHGLLAENLHCAHCLSVCLRWLGSMAMAS